MILIPVEQLPQGMNMDIQRMALDGKVLTPHKIKQFAAAVDF